ncbi:SDR family oxidoreductase [Mucilaginibacter sp. HMF7410]|uniref:SDR family oxidoreductase n=1 Tax=Mucilaginibacter arboris TaxID=2682090 RepID=A0A7K1T1B3_9SPHI|nr:SDR family oxidoreductase [Mucilaginibacter arboris]
MPLNQQVVVITGASSGVGRATALEFARYRCTVILAARQQNELEEVARICTELGAKALAVPTDVTHAEQVNNLTKAAIAFGGKIDVWVNIAGVVVMGEFNAVPLEAHEKVIHTNLLGYVYGAYAVLPYFKQQQSGTIINMNSVGGFVAAPYSVAYSVSKFGARGYSEALRAELYRFPHIHVCDVFPYFLDTPGTKHAGNYIGKVLKPVPPVTTPTKIASIIVGLAVHPRNSVTVGAFAYMARLSNLLLPGLAEWGIAKGLEAYLKVGDDAPVTAGNILHPTGTFNQVSGGFTNKTITQKRVNKVAGIAGAAVGLLFLINKIRK